MKHMTGCPICPEEELVSMGMLALVKLLVGGKCFRTHSCMLGKLAISTQTLNNVSSYVVVGARSVNTIFHETKDCSTAIVQVNTKKLFFHLLYLYEGMTYSGAHDW